MFRILFLLLLSRMVCAQTMYFNTQIDVAHLFQSGYGIAETDSSYILSGLTGGPDSALIVILRKDGSVKNLKTLSFRYHTFGRYLAPAAEGPTYFWHTGSIFDDNQADYHQMYVSKLRITDSVEVIWQKDYGLDQTVDASSKIIPLADGGLAATGFTYNIPENYQRAMVFRCDSTGEQVFYRSHPGNNDKTTYSEGIAQTSGGDFIIAGYLPYNQDQIRGFLMRVDASGQKVWYKEHAPGSGQSEICYFDVVRKPDGTFLAVGCTTYKSLFSIQFQRFRIINFTELGTILWEKEFDPYRYAWWERIIPASDGNFLLAGSCFVSAPADDFYRQYGVIGKITPDGNLLWQRKYSVSTEDQYEDVLHNIIATRDGGILCVGATWGNYQEYNNLWAVKLDSLGCLEPNCAPTTGVINIPVGANTQLNVYPNPTSGEIILDSPAGNRIEMVRIYDILGRLLIDRQGSAGPTFKLDLSGLAPGTYCLSVKTGDTWTNRNIVVQ